MRAGSSESHFHYLTFAGAVDHGHHHGIRGIPRVHRSDGAGEDLHAYQPGAGDCRQDYHGIHGTIFEHGRQADLVRDRRPDHHCLAADEHHRPYVQHYLARAQTAHGVISRAHLLDGAHHRTDHPWRKLVGDLLSGQPIARIRAAYSANWAILAQARASGADVARLHTVIFRRAESLRALLACAGGRPFGRRSIRTDEAGLRFVHYPFSYVHLGLWRLRHVSDFPIVDLFFLAGHFARCGDCRGALALARRHVANKALTGLALRGGATHIARTGERTALRSNRESGVAQKTGGARTGRNGRAT